MTARKILGALLIALVGLPLLFGMIWAVGLVKASVSAEFLSDLPREIIDELPGKADEIFRAAQDENLVSNPEVRAWFRAAAQTGITPRELMEKTGLLGWLRGELSDSLNQVGEVLRGETPWRSISIDLKPLQNALLHPEMDRFLDETLKNLPACDEKGLEAWKEYGLWGGARRGLPACRPDDPLAKEVFREVRARTVRDMDEELRLFDNVRPFPFQRFGVSRAVTMLSYLLFFVPALVIFLGVLIAASSPSGRLRWSGASILAGSLPALVLALGIKSFSLWALEHGPLAWHPHWTTDLGDLVLDKLNWIPIRIIDQLFSPVVGVAAVVSVVGIVLVALSYSVRSQAATPQK
jgi:hypothetical protein